MPKDRKMTYSDHQSQAARDKKQQPKKNAPRAESSPAPAPSEQKTSKS